MRLCHDQDVADADFGQSFRVAPLPNACALAVFVALGAGFTWILATKATAWPTWSWLLLAPFALGLGAMLVLLTHCAWSALRASLAPSNWVMRLAPRGVYLNLRCYLNSERTELDETIAYFEYHELQSARRVLLVNPRGGSQGHSMTVDRYLQLEVDAGQAEALDAAVKRELARPGLTTQRFGVSVTSKSNGAPVFVAGAGVVRVLWCGASMLKALADQGVALAPRERVDESQEPFDPTEIDERLVELCLRGRKLEAIALARRARSLSLREAKQLVEGLTREAA